MSTVKLKAEDLSGPEAAGLLLDWLRAEVLDIAKVNPATKVDAMPPKVRRVVEVINSMAYPLTRLDPSYAAFEDGLRPSLNGNRGVIEYDYPQMHVKTSEVKAPFIQVLGVNAIQSALRAQVKKGLRYRRSLEKS